jgi:hypothetical protein
MSALRHTADVRKNLSEKQTFKPPSPDELEVFGKHVANELRSITDNFTRDYTKNGINDILFEAKPQRGKGVTSQNSFKRPCRQY